MKNHGPTERIDNLHSPAVQSIVKLATSIRQCGTHFGYRPHNVVDAELPLSLTHHLFSLHAEKGPVSLGGPGRLQGHSGRESLILEGNSWPAVLPKPLKR